MHKWIDMDRLSAIFTKMSGFGPVILYGWEPCSIHVQFNFDVIWFNTDPSPKIIKNPYRSMVQIQKLRRVWCLVMSIFKCAWLRFPSAGAVLSCILILFLVILSIIFSSQWVYINKWYDMICYIWFHWKINHKPLDMLQIVPSSISGFEVCPFGARSGHKRRNHWPGRFESWSCPAWRIQFFFL